MTNYNYDGFADPLASAQQFLQLAIADYRANQASLQEARSYRAILSEEPTHLQQHLAATDGYWELLFDWRLAHRRAVLDEDLAGAHVRDALLEVKDRQRAYDRLRRQAGLAVPEQDPWAEEQQEHCLRGEPQTESSQSWTGTAAAAKLPSAWKHAANAALLDRAAMTAFPDPPASNCGRARCALERPLRVLEACECNVAAALRLDPEYPESLKTERVRWHPDKFGVCPEENMELFKKKATEIFVVANRLYEKDGK
jgi:hypothetical protein